MLMKQKHVESVEAGMIRGVSRLLISNSFHWVSSSSASSGFVAGKGAESSRNAGMKKNYKSLG